MIYVEISLLIIAEVCVLSPGPRGADWKALHLGLRDGIAYLKVLLVVSLNLYPQVPPGPLPALGAPQLSPPSSCVPCPPWAEASRYPLHVSCGLGLGWEQENLRA